MSILHLTLGWWYSSCLQMYSDNFFNIYFHEKMFFQIIVPKGDTGQFFWEIIAYEHYNFH